MGRVVDDLKLRTREINAKTKRFVSDSEWLSIDQVMKPKLVLLLLFVENVGPTAS